MKRISAVVAALFIISLWFLCNTTFADIYKYVDSNGVIHLTNQPDDPNIPYILIKKEEPLSSESLSPDQKTITDTQQETPEQRFSIDIFGIFGSCNFYECILDDMPGVKNDIVARQIIGNCSSKCKDRSRTEKFRINFSGRITASKCFVKYAKDTNSEEGARLIRAACYSLYPRD